MIDELISEFSVEGYNLLSRNQLLENGMEKQIGCTTKICIKKIGNKFNIKTIITGSIAEVKGKIFYNISIFDTDSSIPVQGENDLKGVIIGGEDEVIKKLKPILLKHIRLNLKTIEKPVTTTKKIENEDKKANDNKTKIVDNNKVDNNKVEKTNVIETNKNEIKNIPDIITENGIKKLAEIKQENNKNLDKNEVFNESELIADSNTNTTKNTKNEFLKIFMVLIIASVLSLIAYYITNKKIY